MAWQSAQQTMRLLTALQDFGKGQQCRKGSGWGNDGTQGQQQKKRWCSWKTCTAAQQGKPTVGVKINCFSCSRHFSQTPPLEMLVESAYKEKLEERKTKGKGTAGNDDKNKPKGKSAGKGNAKGQQPSKDDPPAEELQKVREQRLEELKAAKAGQPPPPPPPAQTILQGQVALAASRQQVLPPVDAPKEAAKWLPMTLDSSTATIMVELQEALEAISTSVTLDLAPTSFQPPP